MRIDGIDTETQQSVTPLSRLLKQPGEGVFYGENWLP